jgi:hypothetical protein
MDRFLTDLIHKELENLTCMEGCSIDPTDEMQVEAEVASTVSYVDYIADSSFKLGHCDLTTGLWDDIFTSFSPPPYLNDSLPTSSSSGYSLPVPAASLSLDSSDYHPTSPFIAPPTLCIPTRSQPLTMSLPLGNEDATTIMPHSGFSSL